LRRLSIKYIYELSFHLNLGEERFDRTRSYKERIDIYDRY